MFNDKRWAEHDARREEARQEFEAAKAFNERWWPWLMAGNVLVILFWGGIALAVVGRFMGWW